MKQRKNGLFLDKIGWEMDRAICSLHTEAGLCVQIAKNDARRIMRLRWLFKRRSPEALVREISRKLV
jgi:hypothetical protein